MSKRDNVYKFTASKKHPKRASLNKSLAMKLNDSGTYYWIRTLIQNEVSADNINALLKRLADARSDSEQAQAIKDIIKTATALLAKTA